MLTLSVVGRASAQVGSRAVGPGAELVFAGLLVLGLDSGREHTREALAELLWPDRTPSDRNTRLRWLLNRFRSLGLAFDADLTRVSVSRRAVDADYLAIDVSRWRRSGQSSPATRLTSHPRSRDGWTTSAKSSPPKSCASCCRD